MARSEVAADDVDALTDAVLTASRLLVVRGVTERRRAEIAGIVARMPEAMRYGLVEALLAFAEAGGEPPVDVPPGDTAWP